MSLFFKALFQFFLPPQCYCCEMFLPEGQQGLCADCLSAIHWIEPPFCSRCGIPFPSREEKDHLCGVCSEGERYFTMGRAPGCYEGSLREAVHRWKYEGKIHLSPLFGEWMVKCFFQHWETNLFDLLIPVPLHPQRLRERGFNQALLLARELSLRTGIPCRKRVLEKRKPTLPQVNLSGRERERGVKGAFHLAEGKEVREKVILLIDDVYTTGTTANECSKVLMAGGAKRVDVLTLAHTLMNP
jgi:ComF family protein